MYRRCGERKILTSASLREAANTDLDLWLPKIQKSDHRHRDRLGLR
jgi:hypothetical protein